MLKSERRLVAKRQFFDGVLYKPLVWIISHCAEVAFLILRGSLPNRRAGRLPTAEWRKNVAYDWECTVSRNTAVLLRKVFYYFVTPTVPLNAKRKGNICCSQIWIWNDKVTRGNVIRGEFLTQPCQSFLKELRRRRKVKCTERFGKKDLHVALHFHRRTGNNWCWATEKRIGVPNELKKKKSS